MKGFGIDFGTTNSVAAICEEGITRALTDRRENINRPYPSVVWYRGPEVIVGQEAKRHINEHSGSAGNTFVRSVKRRLGKDESFSVLGSPQPAWKVAAEIFSFLKREARTHYGEEIGEAVVTIPVKFDGRARRDIRLAAQEAGIRVLRFVHEPFAALIGHFLGGDTKVESLGSRTALVFDWGGGTLDVTLVQVADGRIWETGTDGLPDIAGDRFDQHVADYALDQFIERYQLRPEIRHGIARGTHDRLLIEAENAKIRLSTAAKTDVQVSSLIDRDQETLDLEEPLSRAGFEALIENDVASALACVERVLDQGRITPEHVTDVLLIGGTSRIPKVRNELRRQYGSRVVEVERADTVIAEGAAIIAAHGWTPYLVKPISAQIADGSYLPLLNYGYPLGSALPPKTVRFVCTDNRDGEARLILAEETRPGTDERRTRDILRIPVSARLPKPYQYERVEVQVDVDDDLVVNVRGWGATQQDNPSHLALHDVCFGLEVGSGRSN